MQTNGETHPRKRRTNDELKATTRTTENAKWIDLVESGTIWNQRGSH